MPIQFACPYCDKVSSVPNSFGGKKGRCPSCKKVIEVPAPEGEEPAKDDAPAQEESSPAEGPASAIGSGPHIQAGDMMDCRFCGESVKRKAKKCRYCGEFFERGLRGQRDRRRVTPFGQFTIGGALSRGWDTAMSNLGPCLAVVLIYSVCFIAFNAALSFGQELMIAGARNDPVIAFGVTIASNLVSIVFQSFFMLGMVKIALDLLRGKPFNIGDLFSQGRHLLHAVLAQILVYIMVFIVLIPGGVLAGIAAAASKEPLAAVIGVIIFCLPPFLYLMTKALFVNWLIVDRDMDCIAALRESFALSRNRGWEVFGLLVLTFFMILAGVLALCVGWLFAYPVAGLAVGTAYLCLSGGRRGSSRGDDDYHRPLVNDAI